MGDGCIGHSFLHRKTTGGARRSVYRCQALKIESTFLVEFDPAVTDIEAVETELRGELEEFWKDVLTDVEEDIPLPEITSEIRWWTRP